MTTARRTFLRTAAATGALALAGCTGLLDGDGELAAGDWLYEPGTVSDVDHYLALRYAPSELADRGGSFDDGVYDAMRAFGNAARDRVDLSFAQTTEQLVFGPNSVLKADFEPDDVASSLEADDYASEGEYEGFDVYVGPGEDAAVGIDDDVLVVARSTGIFGSADNAESILEAILDVNAGNAESYVEDNEDFETLVDATDDGEIQSMRTHEETSTTDTDDGRFAGEVARGIDSELEDDNRIETTFVRVFDEASDIDDGDVEDWVDANQDGTFADFDDVEIEIDGRTVEVTGTEPTSAYDFYVENV